MKIKEVDGKVIIDDFEFYGRIEQETYCSKCKFHIIYYADFDAYFCPKCNSWIESACNDPACRYCCDRPERPLPQK